MLIEDGICDRLRILSVKYVKLVSEKLDEFEVAESFEDELIEVFGRGWSIMAVTTMEKIRNNVIVVVIDLFI